MANISLMQFDPKLGFAFQHGFAPTAEALFHMAFGADASKLDQEVLAEINETRTLYYSRLSNMKGIQYQSTLEKLKTELKEIGEL
ncbi:MAG: hypothetical protein RR212_01160 [Bacteroidales bacterium]